jgi:chromosome segregation ATPase
MRAEPIGTLLAGRGHITEEQLELALTEQKATGRPLGEIIVARGFAAAPTVAQALATQHGGLLKTEYGFATGWGGAEGVAPGVADLPVRDESAALRASLEEHKKALDAWKQSHAQLEERLAQAQAAPAADDPKLAQLQEERETLQSELEARDLSIEQLRAELVAAETSTSGQSELEERFAVLESEREQLRTNVAAVEAGRAELERALAEEVERAASLRTELAAAQTAHSGQSELEERLAALESEREQLRANLAVVEAGRIELERNLSNEVERAASLRTELAAAQTAHSGQSELEERLAALESEREQLGASLAAVEAGRIELERNLANEVERGAAIRAELESVRGGLERELAEARDHVASLEDKLSTQEAVVADAEPAGRWAAAESHLVFFQGAGGYELVERSGPPPSEGSSVGAQIVARIASAPIPGSALPCAYLVA